MKAALCLCARRNRVSLVCVSRATSLSITAYTPNCSHAQTFTVNDTKNNASKIPNSPSILANKDTTSLKKKGPPPRGDKGSSWNLGVRCFLFNFFILSVRVQAVERGGCNAGMQDGDAGLTDDRWLTQRGPEQFQYLTSSIRDNTHVLCHTCLFTRALNTQTQYCSLLRMGR